MKVIPNKAMMTVTTADSKYSRMTVLRGPVSFSSFSIFTSRSRPLGCAERGVKTSGLSAVLGSVAVTGSFINDILEGCSADCLVCTFFRGCCADCPAGALFFRTQTGKSALHFQFHLLQSRLSGRSFRCLDSLAFAPRGGAIPLQLNMKHPFVWRSQGFDDGILRPRLVSRLQFFLQHRLRISRRC